MASSSLQPLQNAMALLAAGDAAGAERLADSILRAAPGHPDAWHVKGLAARHQGRLQDAVAHFNASLESRPDHPYVLGNLGNVLLAAGRRAEAISAYQLALAFAPDHPDAASNLAIAHLDSGNPAAAIEVARQVIADQPGKAAGWATLGRGLCQSGRSKEAIDPLQRSLAIRQGHAPTLQALAVALRKFGRPDQAIALLHTLTSQQPDIAEAHYLLGHCLHDVGQIDTAIAQYRNAVRLRPGDRAMLDTLSRILWQSGKTDLYLIPYADALELAPDDGGILADLVFKLGLANRADDAAKLAGDAVARGIVHPELRHREGQALLALHDTAGAASVLAEALLLSPDDDDIGLDLARALLACGDADSAEARLEPLLGRVPFDQQAIAYQGEAWRIRGDPRYRWLNDVDHLVRASVLTPPEGSVADFNAGLANCLADLHSMTAIHPLDQTLRGGTQTMGRLLDRPEPELRILSGMLTRAIDDYVARLPDDPQHPFLRRKTRSVEFSGSWSVRLKPYGYHLHHVHREGWISSCYYVSLPPDVADETRKQGWISFGRSGIEREGGLTELLSIQPEVGMLVLFPSYLYHGTNPFHGGGHRLTIAFDIVPAQGEPRSYTRSP